MTEARTTGRIRHGRLRTRNRARFLRRIGRMRDGEVELIVRRHCATRSAAQNAWYFAGIVTPLAEHTGYDVDEMHQLLKQLFLSKALAVTDGNGEVVGEYVIGGSTRKLNTIEFGEYCERIRRWAGETLGVVVDDPHEAAA